jgi:hypothetical protein
LRCATRRPQGRDLGITPAAPSSIALARAIAAADGGARFLLGQFRRFTHYAEYGETVRAAFEIETDHPVHARQIELPLSEKGVAATMKTPFALSSSKAISEYPLERDST